MSEREPTAVFEPMYAAAAKGGPDPPWDRGGPHPLLVERLAETDGAGKRAMVVGAGLGGDAEFAAGLGFAVTAFDVSPTAVEMVRERHPGSPVDYRVADLLDLPDRWIEAFDLVIESLTVQSMPEEFHPRAIAAVALMVASGGTLLVIATGRNQDGPVEGPPFPLTRAEVESFATTGLETVRIEEVREPGAPLRWRAEFRRP